MRANNGDKKFDKNVPYQITSFVIVARFHV